jgi:hypothetical protein
MYLRFAPPVFFMLTCSVLLLSRSIRTSPWLNLIHQFHFIHCPSVSVYIFVLSVSTLRRALASMAIGLVWSGPSSCLDSAVILIGPSSTVSSIRGSESQLSLGLLDAQCQSIWSALDLCCCSQYVPTPKSRVLSISGSSFRTAASMICVSGNQTQSQRSNADNCHCKLQ